MYQTIVSTIRARGLSSSLGSLLLLFQRSPLVQMLFPEARILGGAGLGEITKWTVATVAGLGAFDTVAGATAVSQASPSPGLTTVAATSGTFLAFTAQLTGAVAPTGTPQSWSLIGALPAGLVHQNATNSMTDSITGTPRQTGTFTFTVRAWREPNYQGDFVGTTFTMTVAPLPGGTIPAITTQPALSTTISSGGTTTLTVAASGTPTPSYQWYTGAVGVVTSPVAGATSASFTTPALTANTNYWALAYNTAGSANSTLATVTVAKTAQTITFGAVAAKIFGNAPFALGATASSGLTVSYASSNTAVATVSGSNVTIVGAGSTTITASQAGNTTYSAATSVPQTLTVNPAAQTITFGALAAKTLGDAAFSLVGTASSGLAVNYSSSNTAVATISGSNVTLVGAGTTTITASQAGNTNYAAATSIPQTLTVAASDPFVAWQRSVFSTTQLADPLISGTTADPDGDGITNADEYIFGLSPLVSTPAPFPTVGLASGQFSLNFTAKAASGSGYEGKTRHYALKSNDGLGSGLWTDVSGYSDISGSNQAVSYSAATTARGFYRLHVWLTP